MKPMLVLGANGQVGSEVIALAKTQDLPCVGLTRADIDLTRGGQWFPIIEAYQPALIINCAAYTAVDRAETDAETAFQVNQHAVATLAQIGKKLNIPVLHLSTDYVFSGEQHSPYTENAQINPQSVYGQSKWAGEQALRQWEKHVIVRTSWVFGRYGQNFVKTILKLAATRENLTIVADQYGCPTPARSIAAMLLAIVSQLQKGHDHFGTYHYCGAPAVSWYEFACAIIELAKKNQELIVKTVVPIATQDYPTPAKRPAYSVLSMEKIKKNYGIVAPDWKKELTNILTEIKATECIK